MLNQNPERTKTNDRKNLEHQKTQWIKNSGTESEFAFVWFFYIFIIKSLLTSIKKKTISERPRKCQ